MSAQQLHVPPPVPTARDAHRLDSAFRQRLLQPLSVLLHQAPAEHYRVMPATERWDFGPTDAIAVPRRARQASLRPDPFHQSNKHGERRRAWPVRLGRRVQVRVHRASERSSVEVAVDQFRATVIIVCLSTILFTISFFLLLHAIRVSMLIWSYYLGCMYNSACQSCCRLQATALLLASRVTSSLVIS